MPFLENVTRGRGVPRERLEAVAQHYLHFGGISPINQFCNRDMIAALRCRRANGICPSTSGNRTGVSWSPTPSSRCIATVIAGAGVRDVH